MTSVLSPLLLVVLVLISPLTKAITSFCSSTLCNEQKPICLTNSVQYTCICPWNSWGDSCENTCGGNVTDCQGVITSPNYPDGYPNGVFCSWTFQVPSGFRATLTFNDFDLTPGFNNAFCLDDILRLDDVISYCGTQIPQQTQVHDFKLYYVPFAAPRRGFNITYEVGDQCNSSSCLNGATCIQDGCFFTCACPPGFTGMRCEENIDECQSNPCQNGATCRDDVNSYSCVCAEGFTGTLCEDIDDCQSNPCQNGATCRDDVNSYTCVCAEGFTGTLCEENIDECQSNPCQNGATCEDDVNSYTCVCAEGFTGTLCEENIDECQSNPCQNGATCEDDVNSYTCVCAEGFSGTLCEATTYTLTYCIARKVSKWGKLVPPAVNVTLTGSAGSTGTVTLTLRPLCGVCDSVTLMLTYIGDIQAATVTPTHISCNQPITVWNPLYFQLAVSSGVGQWYSFPSTVWHRGAKTKTLAASC